MKCLHSLAKRYIIRALKTSVAVRVKSGKRYDEFFWRKYTQDELDNLYRKR